ncbi:MAG: glycosyltransferase family 4 protein [Phycisphaerae bacterium]|nr:glycosyltransferase family 4 protein [Phycisphaerae bacterium]
MTDDTKDKRILYVTRALTAPPHAGCMIRALNTCRQLKKYGQVTMLAASQAFHQDSVLLCQKEFEQFHQVHLKPYCEYPFSLGNFFLKWHMHWPRSRGIQASQSDQAFFMELVKKHDIVWFHTLGASEPFDINQLSNSVMDLDDLNQFKYKQLAQVQPTLRLRLSAKIRAYKWNKLERSVFKQYKRIVVCSEEDKAYLNGGDETCIIPNGYIQPDTPPEWTEPDPLRIGFIGLLSYGPNRDGLIWFRDAVWPIIRQQKPEMRLRIIGSLPPEKYYVKADGFEYLGYVEDTTEEMQSWSAIVVPIPYGGGTRIKILDAFSKKCPVIATPVGAYGIQGTHREHLLVTESPDEFAKCCLDLSNLPEQGKSLAEAGWKLFQEKYSWDVIGKSIRDIVSKVVG